MTVISGTVPTWRRMVISNVLVNPITSNDVERTVIYVNGGSQRTACHGEDGGKRQEITPGNGNALLNNSLYSAIYDSWIH
jgi:hypothetical protein